MKKVDLIKLTLTSEGEVFTGVHKYLKENLSNEQLRKLLDRMDKVAKVVAELIAVIEEEDENE